MNAGEAFTSFYRYTTTMSKRRSLALSTHHPLFEISKKPVTLHDFVSLVDAHKQLSISPSTASQLDAQSTHIAHRARSSTIYGYNTGFGPMAGISISHEQSTQLQTNLIRSHALGLGTPLDVRCSRAITIARIFSLCAGKSAINSRIPKTLCALINADITPIIPEHGSVGASGDLVQLAHVARAAMGEGDVMYKGQRTLAKKALAKEHIEPLVLSGRDGLALINGTSAMTAIAALSAHRLNTCLDTALTLACLAYEALHVTTEYLHEGLHAVRPHKGQSYVAKTMRDRLASSKLVPKDIDRTLVSETRPLQSVQHQYSIRCTPQVLGPIADTFSAFADVVTTELQSVTDNPIFPDNETVLHGGNFHGDYVSLECDKARIAISKLANLSERRIALLLDPSRNGGRPPFLNFGTLGLTMGLQGIQFVATSTCATIHALATPLSPKGVSTNGDNQDVISVGTDSAIATRTATDQLTIILTIEALALARMIPNSDIKKLSKHTRHLVELVHKHVDHTHEDSMTSESVESLRTELFGQI
jgi:histidine ammonia-lyase